MSSFMSVMNAVQTAKTVILETGNDKVQIVLCKRTRDIIKPCRHDPLLNSNCADEDSQLLAFLPRTPHHAVCTQCTKMQRYPFFSLFDICLLALSGSLTPGLVK